MPVHCWSSRSCGGCSPTAAATRGRSTSRSTIPLLLDAGGNALDLYEEAHIDDVVHVANSAIVSGVVGALFAPRVDERWQAALIGGRRLDHGATAWELVEYGAMRLGADGMDLTYDDTMADLAEGFLGAALGALFTLSRVPRARTERKRRGWREHPRAPRRTAPLRAPWGAACA